MNREDVIIVLGMMISICAVLGLILNKLKQSYIIACISTGLILGVWHDTLIEMVPQTFLHFLSELGIFFVLFNAGMEVDIQGFIKNWKTAIIQGLGQISINMALFYGLSGVFGQQGFASQIFFALCSTLSSTIVVLSTLSNRDEMGATHGQIILGLMVFQDVAAVVGIAVVNALDPSVESNIGLQIGLIFVKLVILLILLAILRFTVLGAWFRLSTADPSFTFFGILGYALGISAICMAFDFSGEMGAFWCGVTIASMPYRMEIEQRMQTLKTFGVALFFIMLGFELEFTGQELAEAIGWAALLACIVIAFSPLCMFCLGLLSKLPSKVIFYNGFVIAQISEFSMILSSLAYKFEVFDKRTYLIIAFGAVISILISSVLHLFMDSLYTKVQPLYACADKCSKEQEVAHGHGFDFKDHVVLLGYNEVAEALIMRYTKTRTVLLITGNGAVHAYLAKQKQDKESKNGKRSQAMHEHKLGLMAKAHKERKRKPRVSRRQSMILSLNDAHDCHISKNFHVEYADITVPVVWDHFRVNDAALVVSCLPEHHHMSLALSKRLSSLERAVPFVAVCDDYWGPERLYKAGASFCLQTDHIASETFVKLLSQTHLRQGPSAFQYFKNEHLQELENLRKSLGSLYTMS